MGVAVLHLLGSVGIRLGLRTVEERVKVFGGGRRERNV